jgi:NifU-like protein
MWEYSDKVKDHYMNPRNAGMLEDANAFGYAGSLACGDAVTLFLKFDEKKNVVDAKFLAFGCGSAVAAASILTEIVIGKDIVELTKITNQDIVDALDGLPDSKIHCSVMCQEVLESAISYYKKEVLQENS